MTVLVLGSLYHGFTLFQQGISRLNIIGIHSGRLWASGESRILWSKNTRSSPWATSYVIGLLLRFDETHRQTSRAVR